MQRMQREHQLCVPGQARRLTRSVQESTSRLNSSTKRRDRVSAISPDHADEALIYRWRPGGGKGAPCAVPTIMSIIGGGSHAALCPPHAVPTNGLVLGLVDQRALLDPRHHVAEFAAYFLDR